MAENKTVSVLMLDIQGSSGLCSEVGEDIYSCVISKFREFVDAKIDERTRIYTNREYLGEFQKQAQLGDDCVKAVFATPHDAVLCAIDIQNQFKHSPVGTDTTGKAIFIALHLAIHHCPTALDKWPGRVHIPHLARLLKKSHGGQILLSQAFFDAYKEAHGEPPKDYYEFGGYVFDGLLGEHSVYSLQYDSIYRGAPGIQLIGFERLEAADHYVPREKTEKQVRDLLGNGSDTRFVTICGEGGMGKTRLSLRCARQMVGRFKGHIAFVPLAGMENPTPDSFASEIYTALQLPRRRSDEMNVGEAVSENYDIKELLIHHLVQREATLLLLDNAETITHEPSVVDYIERLMGEAPRLRFLATSRSWFGLGGGQEGRVNTNDGLEPWEAFQLFQARVRQREFNLPEAVTEEEINACHERFNETPKYALPKLPPASNRERDLLCLLRLFWLANRNSLAIELIASWADSYTATELLTEYEAECETETLGQLTTVHGRPGGDAEAKKRHNSLEASYRWSWKHLGAAESGRDAQSLFLTAALFADTFTRESVDAVLGWNDQARTNRALSSVQDAALLRSIVVGDGTQKRFRVHWQLQAFGRDKKYWQDIDTARNVSTEPFDFYQNFVAYYDKNTKKYGDEHIYSDGASRIWIDDEWRNVIAATRYANKENMPNEAMQLCLSLSPFFDLMGKWKEWEEVILQTEKSTVGLNPYVQAIAHNTIAFVYILQGRLDEAESKLRSAWRLINESDEIESWRGLAATLTNFGIVYQRQKRWRESENALVSAINIYDEHECQSDKNMPLNNLGIVYRVQGRLNEALSAYWDSLKVPQQRQQQGIALENIGNILALQRRWDDAAEAFDIARTLYSEVGDLHGNATILKSISLSLVQQERFQEALKYALDGIVVVKQTDDKTLLQELQKLRDHCIASGVAA